MYYILTTKVEDDSQDAIIEGSSNYLKRILCSFGVGTTLPLEDIKTPILFKLDQFCLRGTMTDHLSIDNIPGPVFSFKTKTLLENFGIKNIQYFQLKLLDEFPEGKNDEDGFFKKWKKPVEYNNYFIANVVGLVDCVDHEKSQLEYFYPPELRDPEIRVTQSDAVKDAFSDENPNDIDFISRLVLNEAKIDPSTKVFRLLDQPNLLIFHESAVTCIKKAGLTGFVFLPVSDYTDVLPEDGIGEDKNEEKPPLKLNNEKRKSGFRFSVD